MDILVFFGVLMVGFFYVWSRGDLDWVRATTRQQVAPVRGRREVGQHGQATGGTEMRVKDLLVE